MLSGAYRFPPMESVVYGRLFAEAAKEQVDRSGANAVFLLASGTLNRETDMVQQLRNALGNRLAGVHARIGAHTPRTDVVDAANAARAAGADLLLTLGGGSVTDASKMVAFCLGNGVTDPAQLDDYRARISADGKIERPEAKPPSVRTVAIPTTLSAGEYTASAGCTDTTRNVKEKLQSGVDDAANGGAGPARHGPHAGMAVPVDRHPRSRSCGRGHLLARVPADLGGRLLSCVEAARARTVGGEGPTRSISTRGSKRNSAPGCRWSARRPECRRGRATVSAMCSVALRMCRTATPPA